MLRQAEHARREVFTAPIKDSIDGHITFNCPTIYQGKEYTTIRLKFKKGKIIDAASFGKDKELNKVLDTDEGPVMSASSRSASIPASSSPSETSSLTRRFSVQSTWLWGTVMTNATTGITAQSTGNMVKLLQGDGKLFFNGKLIQKDGKFVHPKLTSLNPKRRDS